MRRGNGLERAVCALVLFLAGSGFAQSADAPAARTGNSPRPVNPNAAPEARQLLTDLYRLSGNRILSGQHNQPGIQPINAMSGKAREITGKDPALWGNDFGFTAKGLDGIGHRPAMIAEAIEQHRRGSVIALCWHAVCPVHDEPNEWKKSVWYKLSADQWNELVTPGTPLNGRWLAQVDVVAGHLKQLRDAHVPVLWRPYHEMNGNWFWWSGRPGGTGFQKLWRLLYDRFVNHHHLDNLLWVWSPNAPGGIVGPYRDYYPGHDVVDVLAADIYIGFKTEFYEGLLALGEGRPIALGEVGKLPSPAVLDAQPRWVWFLTWNTMLTGHNQPEEIQTLYRDPRVLTLDEAK